MRALFVTSAVISTALASAAASAQSSVTIYGLVDASVNVVKDGGPSRTTVDSAVGGGNRLGFRGTEALGNGLSANFALEMGFSADAGTYTQGGLAFGRQAWVGLSKGRDWSLSLGRQYSPMNIALIQTDTLTGAYWGNLLGTGQGVWQSPGSPPGSGTFQSTGRVDNSLVATATLGPVLVRSMLAAGNETPNGEGRLAQLGATYAAGPVQVAAVYGRVRQPNSVLAAGATPQWQTEKLVGGSYNFGWSQLFAGHYDFNTTTANRAAGAATGLDPRINGTDSNWVGARVPLAGGMLLAQVVRTTMDFTAGSVKGKTIAAAYEYPLSKRTAIFGSMARVDNGPGGLMFLGNAVALLPPTAPGAALSALGFGLRHSF